ncbi:MAG: M48 family metalloprotease [Leptolyngbyaceae cyanobacterium MO_188.B28]|nr:M48 family metalloprotease [Leptolyngbyaceae cyanobacterium MO_188.B28]
MFSDPNSANRDADHEASTHPNPNQSEEADQAAILQSGLTALKTQDYPAAISYLESLSSGAPSSNNFLKAQMGLVRAYAGQGETAQAIALCRQLSQSNRRQVRAWATQTLNELIQQFPAAEQETVTEPTQSTSHLMAESASDPVATAPSEIEIPDPPADHSSSSQNMGRPQHQQGLTGFTPISKSDRQNPGETAQAGDLSGFTPLAPSSSSSRPTTPNTADSSGFAPFQESSESPQTTTNTPEQSVGERQPPDQPTKGKQSGTLFDSNIDSKEASLSPSSTMAAAVGEAAVHSTSPDAALNQSYSQHTPSSTPEESGDRTADASSVEATTAIDNATVDFPPLDQIQWRNAGRLDRLRTLGKVKQGRLQFALLGSAIALFWLVRFLLHGTMDNVNWLLVWIRWPINLQPIQLFYRDPSWTILVFLAALGLLSPWIFDLLLKYFYGMQTFSSRSLTQYSPEAVRILRRVCQKRGWFLPQLRRLPIQAPLCFTYGCLPRYARIVVSEGLLEQLEEDEIAALYAFELGHVIRRWDWFLMSTLGLLLQIIYLAYWQTAVWGDRQTRPILRNGTALISALSYGVYWLIRKVGLWLSRLRTYYSDRTAVELTGNPNGLTRALMKIAVGSAQFIQQQGYTDPLLESIDLLTPLGIQTSLHLSSVITQPDKGLAWDVQNPYRHWLTLNNAHPLTGDRIHLLNLYARYWELEPELELAPIAPPQIKNISLQEISRHWRPLLLQGSPFFGLPGGFLMAMMFKGLGIFVTWMNWWRFDWLYQEFSMKGSLLLGFGIGVILRINQFFPDLEPSSCHTNPRLGELFSNAHAMPTDSAGINTQGKLLGRSGIANWLGQDLILQTPTGLIKLHFLSRFGPIGNLLNQQARPADLTGRTLQVIGWLRRGATGWVDVDSLQTTGNKVIRSNHPFWSTLISSIACLWGIYIIYTATG